MKKVAMLFAGGLFLAICVPLSACGQDQAKTKLEEVYNTIIEQHGDTYTSCCILGSGNSYIKVDTDPLDAGKDGYGSYSAFIISQFWGILEDVNSGLGFPDHVYQSMRQTTWAQGQQTATANGITVTWTYHPNKGLEATYVPSNEI